MKRIFDVIASAAGLIVLAPVLAAVALVLRWGNGGGPILFRQQRVGRHFRPFIMYKFRTMVVGAERMGPGITPSGDPRITPLGRILRCTKLDELPQLWNVLRGDMSLVGPRPELPQYVDQFRQEYAEVLKVRPGITDPASIAFRDESPILAEGSAPEEQYLRVVLPEKLRLAREYVAQSSFAYDLRLIVKTILLILYPGRSLGRSLNALSPHRYPIAGAVQSVLLVLAQYLAFLIRFDGRIPEAEMRLFFQTAPVVLALRLLCFYPFRLYRGLWRYVSITDLRAITASIGLSTVVWWILSRVVPAFSSYPRSVIILDAIFSLLLLMGVRLLRRVHSELGLPASDFRRVLIVGTGDAAERILRALHAGEPGRYRILGLIDDDPDRRGAWIRNTPVLGSTADLEAIARREDPDDVLVAFASTPEVTRKEIIRVCKKLDKTVKFIPDLPELLAGKDALLAPEITPDDLLFREPIRIDLAPITEFYTSRRVLITGAGGSIGSEIARQVAASQPRMLILFEKHEESLYFIDKELRAAYPDLAIATVIGDVREAERVRSVLKRTTPDVIFHAAAYKHVPMMEQNPVEAFKTNVLGTRVVSEVAGELGVGIFVLISTDKAVEPLSMMGRTKRMAELILQGLNGGRTTKYISVRFGNVMDSSGSVVPLFREQIERGGPVTVTHPDVTRLFMTIPEAVQLILLAASTGEGGETFVLDMGKPIRILDLARSLIRLYGLTPGRDIEIVFTGLRPGERLFEKLVNDHENVWKTSHPKLLKAVSEGSKRRASEEVSELVRVMSSADAELASLCESIEFVRHLEPSSHVNGSGGDGSVKGSVRPSAGEARVPERPKTPRLADPAPRSGAAIRARE